MTTDPYPPIGDYAMIGDCHSVALVSRTGSIDWACPRRFDAGSCFGRLLDWETGGHCSITPTALSEPPLRSYVDGTLVLCTVPDPDQALAEVGRILRPGGTYLFLEHVRSPFTRLSRWQDRIQPIWTFFGAGCHPNRDTPAAIERAGFELERLDRFGFSPNLVLDKPHAKGVARKPA